MSALDYLLQGLATVPPERGILLDQSRRMRPEICGFISEAMYDGRLSSHPDAELREIVTAAGAHPAIRPAGVVFLQAPHQGNTQSSSAEADAIALDLVPVTVCTPVESPRDYRGECKSGWVNKRWVRLVAG